MSETKKPSNEYATFKDFARRIVAVPKAEADRAAAKIEPQKPGRKPKDARTG